MTLKGAVRELNKLLGKHKPETFSSSWIFKHSQPVYNFVRLNFRTELGTVDWDALTPLLKRKYQKRWKRYRVKRLTPYENQEELDRVLNKYRDKLYTIIYPLNVDDERVSEVIIIALVRIAQRGNILATRELVTYLNYKIEDWVERRWQVKKWKGRTNDIEDKIRGCIRCYRYTGTFIGYLFKTLEYSGRAIVPMQKYSFDDPMYDGTTTRIDYFVSDTN